MKFKIFIAIFLMGAIVFAVYSATKTEKFAPAEDFPRGVLIYVQVENLPEFIKLWNESKFKEDYLASYNFTDLQNRHLGRKLASRWQEFSDAAGFSLDLETLSGLSENRAALAVYDVGKLEFVFVAPVSEEIFAATKFMTNPDKFAEETLADGTTAYRVNVEADRGRQKQELLFAHSNGRFVLATSEKLLAQTLNNIAGGKLKNRLSDDVSFSALSEKTETHLATVWTNQAALNEDYYFKHYWLMSDVKDLKNIRAGMFDFEMQKGKLIERRKFLLNQVVNAPPIEKIRAAQLLAHLPENIPFYQMRTANAPNIRTAIEQTVFDRSQNDNDYSRNHYFYNSYDFSGGDEADDYSEMSGKYDESITDEDENDVVEIKKTETDFAKILQSAEPQAILNLSRTELLPAPLFVEFKRAAIFHLAAPDNFNRQLFESELAKKFAAQTTVSGAKAVFEWQTKTENNLTRRELALPMLGWKIVYAVRGNELFLANDFDFLREIADTENPAPNEKSTAPFGELTVINLTQREENYDEVFSRFPENGGTDSFWYDVTTFLDAAKDVKKVEIRKNYSRNIFEEELVLHFESEPAAENAQTEPDTNEQTEPDTNEQTEICAVNCQNIAVSPAKQ